MEHKRSTIFVDGLEDDAVDAVAACGGVFLESRLPIGERNGAHCCILKVLLAKVSLVFYDSGNSIYGSGCLANCIEYASLT